MKSYHDHEILGIEYNSIEKDLILKFKGFDSQFTLKFTDIFEFHFSGFSKQNVIYEIYDFPVNEIPAEMYDEFDFKKVSNDISSHINYRICIIDSSIGMDGLILYKTMKY